MDELEVAAEAIRSDDLVVYPTETVYGLGADATSEHAVERVFVAKDRDRTNPISLGVPSVNAALKYVYPSERERQFMERFLPGPVTVLCRRDESIPDVLTGGRDRVGVRVPDHPLALELLDRVAPVPVTATSANVSGKPSARRTVDLDDVIIDRSAAIVDGGELPGTESTVVDVSTSTIYRSGARVREIERWLEQQ